MEALERELIKQGVKQAYIPTFIAGFSNAELGGPLELEVVEGSQSIKRVNNIVCEGMEVLGGGTVTFSEDGKMQPHIHVGVGDRFDSGSKDRVLHLVNAKVQYTTEMLVIEVLEPDMKRIPDPHLFNLPLLNFCAKTAVAPSGMPDPIKVPES